MKAPQIIIIVMYAMSLGIAAVQHGEPRNDKNNFFISSIAVAIQVALLIWGGFFN